MNYPGIDNPERVRKLLQGVAKLEFLQVVEVNEVSEALGAANEILVAEQKANQKNELGTDDSTETSQEGSDNLSDLLQDDEADTTATEGTRNGTLQMPILIHWKVMKMYLHF